jgi:hypothetical protein
MAILDTIKDAAVSKISSIFKIDTNPLDIIAKLKSTKNTLLSQAAVVTGLDAKITSITSDIKAELGPFSGLLSKITDLPGLPEASNLIDDITSLLGSVGSDSFGALASAAEEVYGNIPGLDINSILDSVSLPGFDIASFVPNLSILSDGSINIKGVDISIPTSIPIKIPALPALPSITIPVNEIANEIEEAAAKLGKWANITIETGDSDTDSTEEIDV